jgi:hypothetical protein
VPAHFLRGNPGIDPVIQQFAEHAVLHTAKLGPVDIKGFPG